MPLTSSLSAAAPCAKGWDPNAIWSRNNSDFIVLGSISSALFPNTFAKSSSPAATFDPITPVFGVSSNGSNNNLLTTSDFLSLPSTGLVVSIDGTGATLIVGSQYSYKIGQAGSAITVPNNADVTFSPPIGFTATDYSLSTDGTNALYLNFTPVPEPGTILGLVALGLGAVRLARRRFQI